MKVLSGLLKGLAGLAIVAGGIVDLYSLYLLNLKYGLGAALLAFFSGIGLVFAPFLVGTWVPTLALIATAGAFFLLAAVVDSHVSDRR